MNIFMACTTGDYERVKELILSGIDINQKAKPSDGMHCLLYTSPSPRD
jgi:hypothetical protein